jgi:hypothetical protein
MLPPPAPASISASCFRCRAPAAVPVHALAELSPRATSTVHKASAICLPNVNCNLPPTQCRSPLPAQRRTRTTGFSLQTLSMLTTYLSTRVMPRIVRRIIVLARVCGCGCQTIFPAYGTTSRSGTNSLRTQTRCQNTALTPEGHIKFAQDAMLVLTRNLAIPICGLNVAGPVECK